MIKKSATFGDFVINILESGTVQVLKRCDTANDQTYQACTNTLSVLREIAALVGFAINEKSNTRSNGAKLVDFINANASSVAKEATEPQTAGEDASIDAVPEPCKPESVSEEAITESVRDEDVVESVIKSAESEIAIESSTLTNQSNEEFTEEEMAIIEELLKRIETLEARVAALEKAPEHAAVNPKKLTGKVWIKTNYYLSSDVSSYWHVVLLSDGRRGALDPIRSSDGNFTVGQTRQIADMFGYKYDSKTKREQLGFGLVTKYGDGNWAFIANKAVNADGETFSLKERPTLYDPDLKNWVSNGSKNYQGRTFADVYAGEPFKADPSWTEVEEYEHFVKFIQNLVKK